MPLSGLSCERVDRHKLYYLATDAHILDYCHLIAGNGI